MEAIISPEEKEFITGGAEIGFRVDGRSCDDVCLITIETGVVPNTNGSSRVQMHSTEILAGIKADIEDVDPEHPFGQVGVLGALGRTGEEISSQISALIRKAFYNPSSPRLETLCIIPGEKCWVLYIDLTVVDCGGNLIDALGIAAHAALSTLRLPKLTISEADGQREIEMSDDGEVRTEIHNLPVIVTVNKIGHRYVVDASLEEESCSDAHLVVTVNSRSGRIQNVQKHGPGSIPIQLVAAMLEVAQRIGQKLGSGLIQFLESESQTTSVKKLGFLGW